MNRPFTTREKVMMLILTLLLIGMGYFKLLLEPINTAVDELNAKTTEEENMILDGMAKVQSMRLMEDELEQIFAENENPVPIPSYDNFSKLIIELHSILDGTVDYQLTFPGTGMMSGGYLVSRPIQLTFKADSYSQARSVFNRIHDSVNVNQVSNLSMTTETYNRENDEEELTLSVSMLITYFELIS